MRDLLPEEVIRKLSDRYIAGVANAEAGFAMGEGDEDALTGALGQSISMPTIETYLTPKGEYTIEISYRKLRGRGPNAPEKLTGADGIFQIDVMAGNGKSLRRKGLPFQAKKNWRTKDSRLTDQARTMERSVPGGIVIDYRGSGYDACGADTVIEYKGDRTEISRAKKLRGLGQLLGHDFLACTIGTQGLYFDGETERFVNEKDLHVIDTRVLARR